jgi:hypothetical protein
MPEPQANPVEGPGTAASDAPPNEAPDFTETGEETQAGPPEPGGFVDAVTDLIETAVTYVRQETGDVVREKVVLPTQKAGATVGLAVGVALVLFLGISYVSSGALILLAQYVGWPAALFIVGGILIVASAGIAYARSRSMQR